MVESLWTSDVLIVSGYCLVSLPTHHLSGFVIIWLTYLGLSTVGQLAVSHGQLNSLVHCSMLRHRFHETSHDGGMLFSAADSRRPGWAPSVNIVEKRRWFWKYWSLDTDTRNSLDSMVFHSIPTGMYYACASRRLHRILTTARSPSPATPLILLTLLALALRSLPSEFRLSTYQTRLLSYRIVELYRKIS